MSLLNWSTLNGKRRGGIFKITDGLSRSTPATPVSPNSPLKYFYHSDAKRDRTCGLYLTMSGAQRLCRPRAPSTKHHQSLNIVNIRGRKQKHETNISKWHPMPVFVTQWRRCMDCKYQMVEITSHPVLDREMSSKTSWEHWCHSRKGEKSDISLILPETISLWLLLDPVWIMKVSQCFFFVCFCFFQQSWLCGVSHVAVSLQFPTCPEWFALQCCHGKKKKENNSMSGSFFFFFFWMLLPCLVTWERRQL